MQWRTHLSLCLVRLIPISLGSLFLPPPQKLPVFPIKKKKVSAHRSSPPAPCMPPVSPHPPLLLALAAGRLLSGLPEPHRRFSFSHLSLSALLSDSSIQPFRDGAPQVSMILWSPLKTAFFDISPCASQPFVGPGPQPNGPLY